MLNTVNSGSFALAKSVELADALAQVHFGVASNSNGQVSSSNSPIYQGTKKALLRAIELAYPMNDDPVRIYERFIETNDNLSRCAESIRKEEAYEIGFLHGQKIAGRCQERIEFNTDDWTLMSGTEDDFKRGFEQGVESVWG